MSKMEAIVIYPHLHLFVLFILVDDATISSVSQGKNFGTFDISKCYITKWHEIEIEIFSNYAWN